MLMLMQSISLTMIWAVAMNGPLLPVATFTFDTLGFCQRHSKAQVALLFTYGAFGVSCTIAGPGWFDAIDLFQFYKLPLVFGWECFLITLAFAACYTLILRLMRSRTG